MDLSGNPAAVPFVIPWKMRKTRKRKKIYLPYCGLYEQNKSAGSTRQGGAAMGVGLGLREGQINLQSFMAHQSNRIILSNRSGYLCILKLFPIWTPRGSKNFNNSTKWEWFTVKVNEGGEFLFDIVRRVFEIGGISRILSFRVRVDNGRSPRCGDLSSAWVGWGGRDQIWTDSGSQRRLYKLTTDLTTQKEL